MIATILVQHACFAHAPLLLLPGISTPSAVCSCPPCALHPLLCTRSPLSLRSCWHASRRCSCRATRRPQPTPSRMRAPSTVPHQPSQQRPCVSSRLTCQRRPPQGASTSWQLQACWLRGRRWRLRQWTTARRACTVQTTGRPACMEGLPPSLGQAEGCESGRQSAAKGAV